MTFKLATRAINTSLRYYAKRVTAMRRPIRSRKVRGASHPQDLRWVQPGSRSSLFSGRAHETHRECGMADGAANH